MNATRSTVVSILILRRIGKYSPAQMGALSSLYKHFQAGTMDFVQLMNIDFAESMRCQCAHPYRNLTWDGTTISCQTRNLCIVQPWGAAADESQLTYGSTFADRLLVRSVHLRRLLRNFCRKQPKGGASLVRPGLTLAEYTHLTAELGSRAVDLACLARVVEAAARPVRVSGAAAQTAGRSAADAAAAADERQVCADWARPLLQSLGSDAPACTLVRPGGMCVLQHFVAHRTWASADDAVAAARTLPLLWAVCKHVEASPATADASEGLSPHPLTALGDAVSGLLRNIMEVRYQPAWSLCRLGDSSTWAATSSNSCTRPFFSREPSWPMIMLLVFMHAYSPQPACRAGLWRHHLVGVASLCMHLELDSVHTAIIQAISCTKPARTVCLELCSQTRSMSMCRAHDCMHRCGSVLHAAAYSLHESAVLSLAWSVLRTVGIRASAHAQTSDRHKGPSRSTSANLMQPYGSCRQQRLRTCQLSNLSHGFRSRSRAQAKPPPARATCRLRVMTLASGAKTRRCTRQLCAAGRCCTRQTSLGVHSEGCACTLRTQRTTRPAVRVEGMRRQVRLRAPSISTRRRSSALASWYVSLSWQQSTLEHTSLIVSALAPFSKACFAGYASQF